MKDEKGEGWVVGLANFIMGAEDWVKGLGKGQIYGWVRSAKTKVQIQRKEKKNFTN